MDWDTIVIGSGVGGLTAAVALARRGHRVLVLEQHYLPGGWTHSFALDGYRFSPGLHYLGELAEGRPLRRLFEGLGLGTHLTFRELNPDGYDHFLIDGERFDVPKGRERWLERLKARFPRQQEAIERYFATSRAITDDLERCDSLLNFPRALLLPIQARHLVRWGFATLDSLLDASGVTDPRLRAVLSAQCGNHGLSPSRVSAPVHVSMIQHYLEGAYYPLGGARRLTAAFLKELRNRGGEIRLRSRVARILVERGQAVGVLLADGERLRARHIVSNVDAALTYETLLSAHHARVQRLHARRTLPSVSCVSMFAATDLDLESMGYDSGNYWWYRHSDVGAIYERMEHALPDEKIDGLFVSVSSLKDPSNRHRRHHTLEMFTLVPYRPFERWRDTALGQRGEDYEGLKRALRARMLDAAEQVIPSLRDHLVFCELGTPLTNDFYCNTRRGGCYGSAKTPWQVGPFSFSTTGPIGSLYFCGASTLSHGVAGASLSGLFAARAILGAATIEECLGPPDLSISLERAEPLFAEAAPA